MGWVEQVLRLKLRRLAVQCKHRRRDKVERGGGGGMMKEGEAAMVVRREGTGEVGVERDRGYFGLLFCRECMQVSC